ncbi:hypothetical protein DFQ26_007360 [Actinomortierella ambigua]|nr:hypothetical protein DFQ26_007360 [Actinomortierella ambigua]
MPQVVDLNNQTTSTDGRPVWAIQYPLIAPSTIDGTTDGSQEPQGGQPIGGKDDEGHVKDAGDGWQYKYHGHRVPGPTTDLDDDIKDMLRDMSVRELVGQMTQIEIGQLLTDGVLDRSKVEYWIREWGVGSFLDTPTKLDSVHGANYVDGATLFPQEIGLAASFNTAIAEEVGRITAKDTRAAGIPWVFGPILDVVAHKLWPRVYETFGEDPFVVSEFGRAIIHGLQGNYKKDRTRVAACMKHFIGYAASRDGKDKSSAWIPENFLLDYFVPPFQAAIDVGVATTMETYIDVNGEPVVGSPFFLKELLRDRMGFEGMLVTDWAEVDRQFTEHRTVSSLSAAQLQVLKRTTVDMVMTPDSSDFPEEAARFVEQGKIDRNRLEQSAGRVLQLKKDLGLLDSPKSDPKLRSSVGSQQDVEVALTAIRESLTLLKNKDNLLPLRSTKNYSPRILLTGPAADSLRALSGGWTIKWQGVESDDWFQNRGTTILKGLQREFGTGEVKHIPSVGFQGEALGESDQLLRAVDHSDVAVVCLGESPYAEVVGNINDMNLPKGQLQVLDMIRARSSKIKIVLILVEGRPRGLDGRVDLVDAVLMTYLPGPWGGGPIAEVLSGGVNPSGRLPMTYPSSTGDVASRYFSSGVDPYEPLFAFSAGLSYSSIEYSQLVLDDDTLILGTDDLWLLVETEGAGNGGDQVKFEKEEARKKQSTQIHASLRVKNTGDRPVKETVFWYISQTYRPEVQPEKWMLKGFEKVSLDAGESRTVKFVIRSDMLFYHGRELNRQIAAGPFTLVVNAMRPEVLTEYFNVV